MVARGYTGNARTLAAFRLGAADAVWVLAAVVAAALLLLADHGLR
jgi:hypothetical protein